MFVIKKHVSNVKHERKEEKTMATKTNATVNEPGIIGQMYEDRKSKKRGVLESRESKYKTLMLRDDEGKSFNITYSTFKSNWRKYAGEEVVQTSTQKEETKAEEKKAVETAKKVVEKKSETVKMSTEEKVKKVHAVDDVISAKLENSALKTTRTSKGCIVVRFKKRTLFEIWVKFNLDKYDFIVSDNLVSFDRDRFNGVIEMSDYTYKEAWHLKHLCRVPSDKFEDTVNVLLSLAEDFVANENTNDTKEEE